MNCPTGKNGYHNKRAAGQAAKQIMNKPNVPRELHPYRCPICAQWHLTKRSKRDRSIYRAAQESARAAQRPADVFKEPELAGAEARTVFDDHVDVPEAVHLTPPLRARRDPASMRPTGPRPSRQALGAGG